MTLREVTSNNCCGLQTKAIGKTQQKEGKIGSTIKYEDDEGRKLQTSKIMREYYDYDEDSFKNIVIYATECDKEYIIV